MLVQYGAGVLDARGSIGGQTFSRNRYGAYARSRTTPVNPSSSYQVQVRAFISALAAYWSETLTAAQRAAWDTYADAISMTNKLGQSIKLTGFNHFCRGNAARLQQGLAIIAAGPTTLSLPPADSAFGVAVSTATQLITVTFDATADWCTEAAGAMSLAMSSPRNSGVTYIGAPFRSAGGINGVNPGGVASPQTVAVPFPVATGQVIAVKARILRADGRASTAWRQNATVAA